MKEKLKENIAALKKYWSSDMNIEIEDKGKILIFSAGTGDNSWEHGVWNFFGERVIVPADSSYKEYSDFMKVLEEDEVLEKVVELSEAIELVKKYFN